MQGADKLFSIFDFDGSGKIDINEFLEGARLAKQERQKHLIQANKSGIDRNLSVNSKRSALTAKKPLRKFDIPSMGWTGKKEKPSDPKYLRQSI